MTTKEDLRRLLSKGLTGKEAGRLVLQDNWLADHNRDTFLSQKDINSIKSSMKSTQDIKDYNSFIRSYELLDYTLRQADIARLEAEKIILLLDQYLLMAVNDIMSKHIDSIIKPAIMTEKQYQDVKDKQRARLMKALHNMSSILVWRVEEDSPDYLGSEPEAMVIEPDLEYLVEEEPDKLRDAILAILQLLKTDQIQPVSFSEEYVKKLKAIDVKSQAIIKATEFYEDETVESSRILTDKEINSLSLLGLEEDQIKTEAYKAGIKSQEKLISTLEGLLDGSVKPGEAEAILKRYYVSGEDLYQAGLPEHIFWIDTFKPSFYGRDGTLAGIAIIQDPKSDMLDDRGYYKDDQAEVLRPYKNPAMTDTYTKGHKQAIDSIRLFLAFHSIVEAVSEVIGIDFAEDTRGWLDSLSDIIHNHNQVVSKSKYYAFSEKTGYDIKPLRLEKYKPSAKTVKYLRDRMAISLGDGWDEAKEALLADIEEREAMDD